MREQHADALRRGFCVSFNYKPTRMCYYTSALKLSLLYNILKIDNNLEMGERRTNGYGDMPV